MEGDGFINTIKPDQRKTASMVNTGDYRSIFKATTLFGGVQVYTILIGIIKSKIVAVLLGTAGMGILGLYQSSIEFLQSLTSLGLSTSAVKDISEANATNDQKRISHTVSVLRKLIWYTGLGGMALVIILSPTLSKLSFGNNDYTLPFIFLSVILLFNQISSGQKVLLQGLRRLKDLAKASALGATLGLIVSIPLYYWIGIRGIAPTLILNSITTLLLSWFFARKIKINREVIPLNIAFKDGRKMLTMGIAMTISNTLVYACSYLLRWLIRIDGGVEDVGLFVSGFTLMNAYVGMVFSAMSTDYYPRLSAVNQDNEKCNKIINQQAELAILLIGPLMIAMVVFVKLLISLLYSKSFLPVTDYVIFATIGIFFKSLSWAIAFIFMAKSESRLFIVNETIANIYILLLNIIGYKIGGLTGLGVSFSIGYFIYAIQVCCVTKMKYGFSISYGYIKIFVCQLVCLVLSLMSYLLLDTGYINFVGIILLAVSLLFSYKGLDERLHIKDVIVRYKKKK